MSQWPWGCISIGSQGTFLKSVYPKMGKTTKLSCTPCIAHPSSRPRAGQTGLVNLRRYVLRLHVRMCGRDVDHRSGIQRPAHDFHFPGLASTNLLRQCFAAHCDLFAMQLTVHVPTFRSAFSYFPLFCGMLVVEQTVVFGPCWHYPK